MSEMTIEIAAPGFTVFVDAVGMMRNLAPTCAHGDEHVVWHRIMPTMTVGRQ